MLQGWVVIAVALGYIGLLFLVASYGDRIRASRPRRPRAAADLSAVAGDLLHLVDVLRLGRLASRTGYEFLTIYIGPVLMIGLFSPLIVRIVRLAKAQNITSIADFIAARYGKRQAVAAHRRADRHHRHDPLHRAAAQSGVGLARDDPRARHAGRRTCTPPVLGDIALFVALSMATFAVLFGTRHIDATEHQDGLMLAIATESIVKLFAFLAVGIFVTFWMFDGPARCSRPREHHARDRGCLTREPPLDTLIATTLLSFVAIMLLPRQFHVAVVENNNEGEIKRAAWLFPLYLVLINLFVVPIAIAGLLTFPAGTSTATCSCWRCRCRPARTCSPLPPSSAACRPRPRW